MGPPHPTGPQDALTDVLGLRVGHAQRIGDGYLTGTTVVLAPVGGAVAAVDVRGGGPGTRETDALDPRNLVQRVEALVLTGGSAFGLDAASGVTAWLEDQGRGFRVGPDPAQVVPVVPAAALFDLGRGGNWRARPDAALGRAAADAAAGTEPGAPVARGNTGAGTGAVVEATSRAASVPRARSSPRAPPSPRWRPSMPRAPSPTRAPAPSTASCTRTPPPSRPRRCTPLPCADWPRPGKRPWSVRRRPSVRRSTPPSPWSPPTPPSPAPRPTNSPVPPTTAWPAPSAPSISSPTATRSSPCPPPPGPSPPTGPRPTPPSVSTPRPAALNEILGAGADVLTRAIVNAIDSAETVRGHGGVFPSYRDLYGTP